MKNPQEKALLIGKYGCLAMCYMYCAGLEPSVDFIKICSDAIDVGFLDKECSVLDAEKFLAWLTGRTFEVTKKVCMSIDTIKAPAPVRYDYNGTSHWVVIENGQIVFDPLGMGNSICVKKGRPVTARIIKVLGMYD